MKILLIGAVEFSSRALELLIEMKQDIVGVCTLRDSSFNSDHFDLSKICKKNDISWNYAPDINSDKTIRWMADKNPDVIFCFGWSKLLGKRLLSLAPLGVVGYHPAALPANRGRHPVVWALVLDLRETASTFFFMDGGADSGDILSQRKVEISDEDDATTLYEKITVCALEQIKTFVLQLKSGEFTRTIQDGSQSNTWRKRCEADGQIDWRMSANSIHNLVRGLAKPYVGAHFLYQEQKIRVWKTAVEKGVLKNIEPGKIVAIKEGKPVVKCGEYAIQILTTEPEFEPSCGEYL